MGITYIMITAFTILSLMTGVVSEHISNYTKDQEDEMKKEHQAELEHFMDTIQDLFKTADHDHSNTISRSEFKKVLEDPRLLSLGIEIHNFDMLELFDCLDL